MLEFTHNCHEMASFFKDAINDFVKQTEEEFRRDLEQQHLTHHRPPPGALPKMVDVNSDALQAVGYDALGQRLYIRFRGQSKAYTFYRVPVEVYGGLMNASSKGTYYHQHIRGRYSLP